MEETYEELIENLIRYRKDEIIANTGIKNYKLAVEKIFNNSVFEVRWFILNEERFKEVIDRKIMDSIEKFLNQGGKVYFYIGEVYENGEFRSYMKRIFDKYEEQVVEISSGWKVTTKKMGIFTDGRAPVEFITFDNKGYRYSPEADKCRAIFCANDESFVCQLHGYLKRKE